MWWDDLVSDAMAGVRAAGLYSTVRTLRWDTVCGDNQLCVILYEQSLPVRLRWHSFPRRAVSQVPTYIVLICIALILRAEGSIETKNRSPSEQRVPFTPFTGPSIEP